MSWQEIEPREQQWLAAFNGGDAAGVARLYTEDARFLPPNVDVLQGRQAIEEFVAQFMQMRARLAFTLLGIHESPAMCAQTGRYELEFQPEGGEPVKDSGKFVVVWTRDADGSWLIAEDMFNSSLPAPGS